MLCAIDIGNTNISAAIFDNGKIIGRFKVASRKAAEIAFLVRKLRQAGVKHLVICSVVPALTRILKKRLEAGLRVEPVIIGKDIVVPIKNRYRYPSQVGQDRLVNAYAGLRLYRAPLVVIDSGTAITFDIVSAKGEYIGGMILPGLQISLEALNQRTALLPRIKLERPREFIGRDTVNSMRSGMFYGFSGLFDALSEKIKKKLGAGTLVIGTGGNINDLSRYCRCFDAVEPDLTVKGLNLIFQNAKESLPHRLPAGRQGRKGEVK